MADVGEIPIKPRNLKQFKRHVKKLSDNPNSKEGFEGEFSFIEKRSENDFFFEDFTSARLPHNRPKNRFTNVLPLENSRVHLPLIKSQEGSDYINANYIAGDDVFPDRKRWYIAGQGPLKDTMFDFWRMVWNELSTVIVMLTKTIENDRQKCHQYWPKKGCKRVKDTFLLSIYTPALLDTEELVVQKIRLDNLETREYRDLYHFQYREWPDHGLPKSTEKFRQMLDLVDLYDSKAGPLIVHCSAGIGRTGTFCTVHNNLAKLKHFPNEKTTTFDILGTVLRLRKERVGMVQTREQYMFCYLAVLEGAMAYTKARKLHEKEILPLTPNGHEVVEKLETHTCELPPNYCEMKMVVPKRANEFGNHGDVDRMFSRGQKKRSKLKSRAKPEKKKRPKREKLCLTDSGTSSDEEPPDILRGRASPTEGEAEAVQSKSGNLDNDAPGKSSIEKKKHGKRKSQLARPIDRMESGSPERISPNTSSEKGLRTSKGGEGRRRSEESNKEKDELDLSSMPLKKSTNGSRASSARSSPSVSRQRKAQA